MEKIAEFAEQKAIRQFFLPIILFRTLLAIHAAHLQILYILPSNWFRLAYVFANVLSLQDFPTYGNTVIILVTDDLIIYYIIWWKFRSSC